MKMVSVRTKKGNRPLRILYVDGPGNVLGTFRKWREGRHDSNEVSFAFSEEFYSLAKDLNAEAIVVATHDEPGSIKDGNLTVLHHPVPSRARGGIAYHLGEIGFALWLIRTAVRSKVDVLIIADRIHWFALWPARLFGIRIVAMLHNALWPCGFQPTSRAFRVVSALNGIFWRTSVESTLCISPEVERQYSLVMGFTEPAYQVRPQYFPEVFANIPPTSPIGGVLCCFFAGRVARGKGAFDLIKIAEQLQVERPGEFHFEIAGDGTDLEEMRSTIVASGLQESFRMLGQLQMDDMARAYGRSQVVIVPTNATFTEGMNRVCIEAILAHRPVVTSRACPAIEVLGDAVLEVPVGDIGAYCRALLALKDDPDLYQRLSRATEKYVAPFFDRSQGYRACLHRAIAGLPPGAPLPT
jgi:glycosyltransferase involved in cell wall biosynthesis